MNRGQTKPSRGAFDLGWAGGMFICALCVNLTPSLAGAQETPEAYFKNKCANCHYIGGGKLIGPDLKDIHNTLKLKGPDWLVSFIRNPKGMVASDDYARKLWEDYNRVDMIVPDNMSDEWAKALLDLIDKESKKANSQFARAQSKLPAQFSDQQVEEGRELFVGLRSFANDGPSCLSCHAVQGISAIGGGRLGPDLTQILNKLKGREGLFGWLSSPPTATMQPIFKQHPLDESERIALVAFLDKARENRPEEPAARLNFFLLGLAGTAGGLALCDYLWRRRFRAVRQVLVQNQDKEHA